MPLENKIYFLERIRRSTAGFLGKTVLLGSLLGFGYLGCGGSKTIAPEKDASEILDVYQGDLKQDAYQGDSKDIPDIFEEEIPCIPRSEYELCGNKVDDNCNGETDEEYTGKTCWAGIGECEESGNEICWEDGTTACDAEPKLPSDEICDGLDNDCDGETDEDCKPVVCWEKTFGGSGWDIVNSIQQTADGGYIGAGWTSSKGAGGDDVWILKLDQEGNLDCK